MNISTPFSLIHRGRADQSMCIRVVLIKEKAFLSGTVITGNDVIVCENEVQCIFFVPLFSDHNILCQVQFLFLVAQFLKSFPLKPLAE